MPYKAHVVIRWPILAFFQLGRLQSRLQFPCRIIPTIPQKSRMENAQAFCPSGPGAMTCGNFDMPIINCVHTIA